MQIYLARNNVQAGPYTLSQLNRMLASKEVELNDLMWHEGMERWQRVGSMTNETLNYRPHDYDRTESPHPSTTASASSSVSKPNQITPNKGRTSVERLYGRPPSTPSKTSQESASKNRALMNKNAVNMLSPKKVGVNELASIPSRILAVLLDQVLATLCLIPLFAAIDFDMDAFYATNGEVPAMMALFESAPQHLLTLFSVMTLGLIIVQIIMLLKRGQSIGKLATGVRILDVDTHLIPKATNIILIRTILTNLAYSMSFIGLGIALADTIVMLFDPQRRSLHDKLAKTYVVKAESNQLIADTEIKSIIDKVDKDKKRK